MILFDHIDWGYKTRRQNVGVMVFAMEKFQAEKPEIKGLVRTCRMNQNYLWIPTPEEVESGIVSLQEYQLRVLTCNEMKKNGREFRFLSTNELPPEDRAAILGNASGINLEKSPEKTPPEPEPLSALRQSLSEKIEPPNDELR
ncbi:MAG: hypothetical protein Q4A17_14470 [Thermoguttaceae bacterium]|nr:hypothetical protein [Thermoguttaceae bacterium]